MQLETTSGFVARSTGLNKSTQAPIATPKKGISVYLVNAGVLIRHEEWSSAEIILKEALALDSTNDVVLDRLVMVLETQEKWTEACRIRQELYRQHPSLDRCMSLANCYYMAGHDDQAFQQYFEYLSHVEATPENSFECLKNLGNLNLKNRDFESAKECYDKAYTLNKGSDVLYVNYGVLYFQQRNLTLAIESFRKALQIKGDSSKSWVGLSMCYKQLGDEDLAWGNLVKALDVDPKNKSAVVLLGGFTSDSEKVSQILTHCYRYLQEVNFDEEVSLLLIQCCCLQNKYSTAYLEAEKAFAWNNESENLRAIYNELQKLMNQEGMRE